MTDIEDQIAELLAKAEPLRALPDLEAEKRGLPELVDRINALRAEQALGVLSKIDAEIEAAAEVIVDELMAMDFESVTHPRVATVAALIEPARKKPGRPKKVAD